MEIAMQVINLMRMQRWRLSSATMSISTNRAAGQIELQVGARDVGARTQGWRVTEQFDCKPK
ncbi:hypothetical protein XarbCFBP8130_15660 [Xanthomonas arboricola]|nr:hypothetical protein XarbCFBP8130_15660 [Xanthomonas arboricola]